MDERAPVVPQVSRAERRCNSCGCVLEAHGGQPAYHLVPAGQMDRAAAGGHVPWSLWLCAACYQREHS